MSSRPPAASAKSGTAPAQTASTAVTGPAPRDQKRRKTARARRKRASYIRSFFLAIVLAGLAAWYFYGQPGDDIARLPALVDAYLDPAPAEAGIAPPVVTAAADDKVAVEPDASIEPVMQAASEPSPQQDAEPQPDAEPLPEPLPDAAATEAAVAEESVEATDSPGDTLIQSFVTVYERDGAARIAFRRPLGTTGTLYWWTGDHTAIAERDYIALEQPRVAFASGEEAETLHIPLVNDSLPEPRETFYVFLGQRDVESGRLEPIARVRVDVNDDD